MYCILYDIRAENSFLDLVNLNQIWIATERKWQWQSKFGLN